MNRLFFIFSICSISFYATAQLKDGPAMERQIEKLHQKGEVTRDSIVKLMAQYVELNTVFDDSTSTNRLDTKLDGLWNLYDSSLRTEVKNDLEFARLNPNSMMALKLIRSRLTRQEGMGFYDTYESVFQGFSDEIKASEHGKEMAEKLQYFKKSKVGSAAPDFTLTDNNGTQIALKDYKKSKYVLIDFWASWCGPCKEELPYIKNLYQKYRQKGFEIISISTDEDLAKWKAAIAAEQIDVWKQVSILQNDNGIIKDYFVHGVPHKVLIDKNGIIIGKWKGSGTKNKKELENMLSRIFEK